VITRLRKRETATQRPLRWILENVSTQDDDRPGVLAGREVVEHQLGGRGVRLDTANFGSQAHRRRDFWTSLRWEVMQVAGELVAGRPKAASEVLEAGWAPCRSGRTRGRPTSWEQRERPFRRS